MKLQGRPVNKLTIIQMRDSNVWTKPEERREDDLSEIKTRMYELTRFELKNKEEL